MNEYTGIQAKLNSFQGAWIQNPMAEGDWTLQNPVGIGESGSLWIVGPDGIRAIAKPAHQNGTFVPRAAHEKIASDLAFHLAIPCPPVALWQDPVTKHLFALSRLAFPQALTFDQARASNLLTPKFVENLLPTLAMGFAFHTWIGDTDHTGNDGNFLIDADSCEEDPKISFIDHAHSMLQSWTPQSGPCCRLAGYCVDPALLPNEHIVNTIKRVENLDEEIIKGLIRRVPRLYLSETQSTHIEQCLLGRRGELRGAFS